MSDIAIGSVLAQMRALSAAAERGLVSGASETSVAGPDFAQVLKQSIQEVNQMQQTASATAVAFQRGEPDVDIAKVMISLEKASLAFDVVTQTRNRVLSAYQEIMSMPL